MFLNFRHHRPDYHHHGGDFALHFGRQQWADDEAGNSKSFSLTPAPLHQPPVLYCTTPAVHCTSRLYCTVQGWAALHCTVSYVQLAALHSTVLLVCNALHLSSASAGCTALDCTALYSTYSYEHRTVMPYIASYAHFIKLHRTWYSCQYSAILHCIYNGC